MRPDFTDIFEGFVVPRDRIELSTPAFSGLPETQENQYVSGKRRRK
ncbi:MAG: hypothetical protein LZF62_40013 [Nitrospira sp.]|nr:MAG: hypothetical protein LZF62_40013 [Nitrospira sp.]